MTDEAKGLGDWEKDWATGPVQAPSSARAMRWARAALLAVVPDWSELESAVGQAADFFQGTAVDLAFGDLARVEPQHLHLQGARRAFGAQDVAVGPHRPVPGQAQAFELGDHVPGSEPGPIRGRT